MSKIDLDVSEFLDAIDSYLQAKRDDEQHHEHLDKDDSDYGYDGYAKIGAAETRVAEELTKLIRKIVSRKK